MGMGMLFAGALTGAAKGLGGLADSAIKREDEERKRATSIMDRRDELLYEMELKSRMAREQETLDANAYQSAIDTGKAAGDDRRFAKFAADIRASGGGEGMGDAQLRTLFDEHYNDKVVSGEPGGARYYEPESADKRDALQAARKSGASGKVVQALGDEYRTTAQAERQTQQDAARDARDERRRRENLERDEQRHRNMLERDELRLGWQAARGDGGGRPAKEGALTDVQKARLKPLENALKAAETAAEKARPSQRDEADKKYQAALDAYNNALDNIAGGGAARSAASAKSAAPQSTVKDNQTTAPKRYVFVGGKIVPK